MAWRPAEYSLGDPSSNSAKWLQHPVKGQEFDVGALPITASDVGLGKDLLAPDGHDPDMFIDLGGELFLPGFPLGLAGGDCYPSGNEQVWRRHSNLGPASASSFM